jgi:hypothetical protein
MEVIKWHSSRCNISTEISLIDNLSTVRCCSAGKLTQVHKAKRMLYQIVIQNIDSSPIRKEIHQWVQSHLIQIREKLARNLLQKLLDLLQVRRLCITTREYSHIIHNKVPTPKLVILNLVLYLLRINRQDHLIMPANQVVWTTSQVSLHRYLRSKR